VNDDSSEQDKVKVYAPLRREDWVNRKWRPMMAVTYMCICIFDFILGPIINFWFFRDTGATFMSWKPLTMNDGGLFHLSMGAIIGITAWQRGMEKVSRYKFGATYDTDAAPHNYQDRTARRPLAADQPEI
jgi:hypothetical protein